MVIAPTLPDLNRLDPEALKALVLSQHHQLLSRIAELTTTQDACFRAKLRSNT